MVLLVGLIFNGLERSRRRLHVPWDRRETGWQNPTLVRGRGLEASWDYAEQQQQPALSNTGAPTRRSNLSRLGLQAMRAHRRVAQAVVRNGVTDQVRRRKPNTAWSESDLDGNASVLCRSYDDLATVAEWTSAQPLPVDEVYFDAVETADLRAAKDDMSSLQAEHDHLATVRQNKQERCEAIQQELREIALSRVAPPAISEQRYLSSQMLAIEEARKAEGKYQGVLTGMVERSQVAYRQAEGELEALQRVARKCDKELRKAKKYRTSMTEQQETCIHELRKMRSTMHKVGKTRRAQLMQLTKLHGTERELMRRAVARELRKQDISQAVTGDLTLEDEKALQEYNTVMEIEASNRQGKQERGMHKHMGDMQQAMQLLCEVRLQHGHALLLRRCLD